jgi:hypothetical protein
MRTCISEHTLRYSIIQKHEAMTTNVGRAPQKPAEIPLSYRFFEGVALAAVITVNDLLDR